MAQPSVAEILQEAVTNGKIPYGVVHATNGKGTFTLEHAAGNLGFAGADSEKPLRPDAMFTLASQTKLLTSIAVLQVIDQGLIGLNDDVAKYLPDLAVQPILEGFDENDNPITRQRKTPITVRHLLTHTAGCAYDAASPDLQKWRIQHGQKPSSGTTMATRFTYPLIFEPGTRFFYGTCIDWAGRLVENIKGQTLQEYMIENILKPLGLSAHDITFFAESTDELKSEFLPIASRQPDGQLVPFTGPTLNQGAQDCFGGHGASARLGTYLQIMRSLLANDGKLLKPETFKQMFTSQIDDAVRQSLNEVVKGPLGALFVGEFEPHIELDWGLGCLLFTKSDVDRRKKGSITWGGYYNTFWLIDPEADLALTFGTQVVPPGDRGVAQTISEIERGVYREAGVKF